MKQTLKLLAISALMLGGFALVKAPSVHAASLTVNSTADTTNQDDGSCTLREAINNVNAGSDTTDGGLGGDCAAGTGSDDTITLPTGAIVLVADLPQITEPVTIKGQGMGKTVIDGDGAWEVLSVDLDSGDFTLTSLTIKAFSTTGIRISDPEKTTVSQVEVDGSNVVTPTGYLLVLGINNDTSYATNVDLSDIYIHDFDVDASAIMHRHSWLERAVRQI